MPTSPPTEEYVRGTMAEQMALRFLRGELPLTNNVLVGLHQQLIVPSLIGRIVEASRKGAGLAKQVKTQGRSLRQIVEDSDFEWNPPSEARVEREENAATDWVEPERGEAEPGARHDGDARHGIGEGDEVFRASAKWQHVQQRDMRVAAFPATPEGVVEAALYELHRGEKRSLGEVEGESTAAAKLGRGPAAAREGTVQRFRNGKTVTEGTNDDPLNQPAVGHVSRNGVSEPRGPVGVYQERGTGHYHSGEEEEWQWCGSFVAFVYGRCGIDVGKGFASAARTPHQLAVMEGSAAFIRENTGEAKTGERQSDAVSKTAPYFASYELAEIQHTARPPGTKDVIAVPFSTRSAPLADAAAIDIRPGDVAWQMHNVTSGHVMLVIGVVHRTDGADVVTVEGNHGDEVSSGLHHLHLRDGRLSGDIVGWGRPPQLEAAGAAPDSVDPAILDTIKKGKHGSSRTR